MLEPRFAWHLSDPIAIDPAVPERAGQLGCPNGSLGLLAGRGIRTVAEVEGYLGPAEAGLHDPAGLPDAERLHGRLVAGPRPGRERPRLRRLRCRRADRPGHPGPAPCAASGWPPSPTSRAGSTRATAFRRRAVERAAAGGHRLIITVDTGSSSVAEVAEAGRAGDRCPRHRPPPRARRQPPAASPWSTRTGPARPIPTIAWPAAASPSRSPSCCWPTCPAARPGPRPGRAGRDRHGRRRGAHPGREPGDRPDSGWSRLRTAPLVGLAALLARAGQSPASADLETVSFVIAPRLNAAGRVGSAADAAALLLTDDPAEAASPGGAARGQQPRPAGH